MKTAMDIKIQNFARFDKFWTPEPNSGCWIWIGARATDKGYGKFHINGSPMLAHRASWTLYRGDVPPRMCVLHKCDIPACVNPDHLFIGSLSDNTRDSMKKGRYFRPSGELCGAAKLTEKQVEQIRHLIAGGLPQYEIAAMFGVSNHVISQIKLGKTWKHSNLNVERLAEACRAAFRLLEKIPLVATERSKRELAVPEQLRAALAEYEKGEQQ